MPLCRKVWLCPPQVSFRSLAYPDPKILSSASSALSSIHFIGPLSTTVDQDQWQYVFVCTSCFCLQRPSYLPFLASCSTNHCHCSQDTLKKNQLHLSRNKVDVPRPKTRHDSSAIPTSAAHPIESRKPLGHMRRRQRPGPDPAIHKVASGPNPRQPVPAISTRKPTTSIMEAHRPICVDQYASSVSRVLVLSHISQAIFGVNATPVVPSVVN